MELDLMNQMANAGHPLACAAVWTGSALPVAIRMPTKVGGADVTGVKVYATNADGVELSAVCELVKGVWRTLFSASGFTNYGFVTNGFRVEVTLAAGDVTSSIRYVGDLEVKKETADARPGLPSSFYVVKGDKMYLRSQIVNGVQHYVEQAMEFDPDIGWGANWTGDYILDADGNFVPAN